MKYSIVIPTYNKLEETLKPCLESIIKYTDLEETEIIVIANGCTDGTIDYVSGLRGSYPNIYLFIYQEALGYTKAVNQGINLNLGEYIVLLNNDTILLPQPKNQWLEILNEPFKDDKVAITGPMKTYSPQAGRDFLIFFCVMIKAQRFKDVGMLDEIFSPGYGEDTDWCCRAEDMGYKIKQVPVDRSDYYADKRMVGEFPIYHEGNVTFKNWPGGEELLARNNKILEDRYNYNKAPGGVRGFKGSIGVDISKAQQCDGYMSDTELTWLAEQASKTKVFIEVGSWHGRSSRAIADNLHPEGILYCVDHWLGSEVERDTHHQSARWEEGDHAYLEFLLNMWDHVDSGKVIPVRLSSKNAAKFLQDHGVKADTIFIDAGHTYLEVKEDIKFWSPLLKDGGTLCGHDYYHDGTTWPGVQQAVDEEFGHKGTDMGYIPNNSIWRHQILRGEFTKRPDIYDCFPFNNELDILERRFEELYDVVDRFVIVEATMTHSNKPKQLHFQGNLDRFEKYLNKVTHIVVDDYPATDPWSIERHQRDCIMRGLTECKDNDIIIISDADEIPNKGTIELIRDTGVPEVMALEMDLFYYNERTKAKDKWMEARVAPYKDVRQLSPCGVRYFKYNAAWKDAGKHLSYFGTVDQIIEKIENTAHQEYNKPEFKDKYKIAEKIFYCEDIFDRQEVKFERV